VDATERHALLAAALALPGVCPREIDAAEPPDDGVVAVRYLSYEDRQSGAERMRVTSPAFYLRAPLSDALTLETALQHDSVTGASPLFHDTLSGASGAGVNDYRKAGDIRLTRRFDRSAVGIGAAYSTEHDYRSRAVSVDLRLDSDDRNRTLAFGLAGTSDRIDSVNEVAVGEKRHTVEFLAGITQALSRTAIVQSNLGFARGHGYYSDPYKLLDQRPDHRRVLAWLTRFHLHLPDPDATLRLGYRFTHDSFGSDSHTLELAWQQPLPQGWSITPSLRYYTQGAADFYRDPPFPQGFEPGAPYSADTRLAAFGALAPGIRIAKTFSGRWTVDVELEIYRQRADWRPGGGSPDIATFTASMLQVGLAYGF
jgi:hypothetical protein